MVITLTGRHLIIRPQPFTSSDGIKLNDCDGPFHLWEADRTAPGAQPMSKALRVGVVRPGGRYFVVTHPARRAGELMVIAALDAEFRRVAGLGA